MNRKEQAILTKKKLFETSVKLIKEKGFDNISVNEICTKANVAKGTFYVHYKAKEDIIKEIYYLDMNNYITEKYHSYLEENLTLPLIEKLLFFLSLELEFANYVGLELTSLAFGINLSQCSKGNSDHFSRRKFTAILKDLIHQGLQQNIFLSTMTEDEIFLYLETMIRGLMASWCFSNNSFNIETAGKKFIQTQLSSIINNKVTLI